VRETKAVLEGSPDILVNNAGLFGLSPAATLAPREFDRHLDVNLRAPFHLVRAFLPDMLERGDGTLVHIGSIAGRQAFPENAAYAASKFGLRGLHEVLCLELAGTGVVSLLVEPGPVDTNAWDPLDDRLGRDLPARVQMLRPETVAAAVVSALKLVEEGARSEILVLPA
jgi:NAD(P)-dependent dehydrogenase (short-subunit alcohol dehydrogenase family)